MALYWQIPYTVKDDEIVLKSLNISTIYTDKQHAEIDLTNQLNDKKIKVNWTELNEEDNVLLIPYHEKLLTLILELEPINRNESKKSFNGKLLTPTAEEVLNYGY